MSTMPTNNPVPAAERAATRVAAVACPLAEVPTATPDEPVADLPGRLSGCSDGRVLVMGGGRLVGIASPSDLSRVLRSSPSAARRTVVAPARRLQAAGLRRRPPPIGRPNPAALLPHRPTGD
jgi:hypothetical protein